LELLRGVRGSNLTAGELLRSQNWIAPLDVLAEATFVPPPAAEVPDALDALLKFVHNDTLPLLIISI